MKHEIILQHWDCECSDHCSSKYGQSVFVDGEEIDGFFVTENARFSDILQEVLRKCGVDCDVIEQVL